jgi:two-component system, response regulator YesN
MFQLMIVDDEERARIGIRTLIDWTSHGIAIVGEARDGAEALELMHSCHVDILITDIRMPVMDGLELIERVSALYPHIKSVIMSGYDEFAYAKKAMGIGASDYLLKPSRTKEILDTVLKLVDVIREERMKQKSLEELRSGFRESFPLLKEQTLSRLVLADNPPYRRLLEILHMNGLIFTRMFYGVMVLQVDDFHSMHQKYGSEDIELFKYGLKNIAEETLSAKFPCAAFEHEDSIILLLNTEEMVSSEALIPYVEEVQRNVSSFLKFSISVGIGSMDRDVGHLRRSYLEAFKSLERRFYVGTGKIVDYTETVDDDQAQTSYPLAQEKALLKAVTTGSPSEIESGLKEFNEALKPESTSKEHVLKSTVALVFALYRFCIEKNIDTNDIFGQDLTKISHIMSQSSMEYIKHSLLEILSKISEQLNAKKNSNKLFQAVLDYIKENYRKDINRETVAREVFITPGYLSLMFKQELKTNFLEYLHQIRIEQACLLLRQQSLKISDIAHDVGYNDEKYFFQVFKKYTGLTPNQYRNNTAD